MNRQEKSLAARRYDVYTRFTWTRCGVARMDPSRGNTVTCAERGRRKLAVTGLAVPTLGWIPAVGVTNGPPRFILAAASPVTVTCGERDSMGTRGARRVGRPGGQCCRWAGGFNKSARESAHRRPGPACKRKHDHL